MNPLRTLSLLMGGGLAFGSIPARAQSVPDFEQPPVSYSATAPRDAVTRLQQRLASGALALAGSDREILRAVLHELNVPLQSQLLVFSKTSLQRGRIRPTRPRALYFSDSVYVGWVPGGLIEIAAIDPQLGPVFYAFDPRPDPGVKVAVARDADCLRCHGGNFIRDIPGIFARSVVPSRTGEPLLRHGTQLVDDETPFEQRWGGWYVTGYHGKLNHRGNAFGTEEGDRLIFNLSEERPADVTSFFDPSDYPMKTSDVVALLVFEHQMAVQNALTHAAHSCRRMLNYQLSLQTAFHQPQTAEPAFDSVKSVFASAVENVVDHLLFRQAAPLPEGVVGSPAFRDAFLRDAPRNQAGQALRDFQLRERLFANRCSYMIYSAFFNGLPAQLKSRVLDRLQAALHDEDPRGRYAYIDNHEKRRIYKILLETHPAARAHWQAEASENRPILPEAAPASAIGP